MKLLKRAVPALAVIFAVCATSCSNATYSVYTNVPQGAFEIVDKSYKAENSIGGYSDTNIEFENIDTSGYETRERLFFSIMNSDANMCISANFGQEGAEMRYNDFVHAVVAKLNEIDRAISTTYSVEISDISKFNAAKAGETIEISKITYEVLKEAKYIYDLTEGYYNPALYYNVEAYGFGSAHDYPASAEELPQEDIIAKYTDLALHFGDINPVYDGGNYTVKKPEYTVEVDGQICALKLDLGGIGKGYAVDCIDELFKEYGYKFGYFNFGASSMLVKSNVNTGNYDLGLNGPRSLSRDPYIKLSIREEKLSTSGDNEQFYIIDGTRYCHIIDPTTGKPVRTGIMSATVIGGSAAEADALTTAIMAMGRDRASEFIKTKLTDRRVVFTCE